MKKYANVYRPPVALRARLAVAFAVAGLASGCPSCDPPASTPDAGACAVGSAGCACRADDVCDNGLVCVDDVCARAASGGLTIARVEARACELLLTEQGGGRFVDVAFSSAVTGRVVREGNKAAIAFHANSDAAIGNDAVTLSFTGTDRIEDALALTAPRCFDKDGAPLAGGGVSF